MPTEGLATGSRAERHLVFGHGPHYYIGAPLARLEAATVLRQFSRRFSDARLADEAAVWGPNLSYAVLDHLFVDLGIPAVQPGPGAMTVASSAGDAVEAGMPMPTWLVCLPFAGAGASFYYPWSDLAGERLEVVPLQLPGRERWIDIEPYRDAYQATDGLLADLRGQLSGGERVALFGHSLGAVLAYELAHRLASMPEVVLVRLFVSGSPAPGIRRSRRATGLPDEEFLLRVKEFAGYDHEALDDPELRELILPTLRADVEMHENYLPSTEASMPVPITSIRGSEDELVTVDEAASWATATSRALDLVELPGGHMYLTESAPALLRLITATVH